MQNHRCSNILVGHRAARVAAPARGRVFDSVGCGSESEGGWRAGGLRGHADRVAARWSILGTSCMQLAVPSHWSTSGAKCISRWARFKGLAALMFCIAGCSSTYTQGLENADATLLQAGVASEDLHQPLSQRVSTGIELQDTEMGRQVREALLRYPAVAAQQSELDGAVARLDALAGTLRPQVSAGLSAGQDLEGSDAGAALDARLTVSQLLMDGGSTRNRISRERIGQLRLAFELELLLSELSLQMATAWLNVWQERTQLELAQDNLEAHRQFLEQVQRRAESGLGAQSDLFSARSRLADVEAALARSQSAVLQAEATFVSFFGRSPGDVEPPDLAQGVSAETARQRLAQSSRMTSTRLRLAAALSNQDVVAAERFPSFSIQLTGARTDVFSSDAENDTFVGFAVDQSLFSGGQQRAREREAGSQVDAAIQTLAIAERELQQRLDVALSNRVSAAAQSEAIADAVRFNEENLEAVRDLFGIGRRTIVDILDAQSDLSSARSRHLVALANSFRAELAILELTGDLAPAFGVHFDPFLGSFRTGGSIAPSAENQKIVDESLRMESG